MFEEFQGCDLRELRDPMLKGVDVFDINVLEDLSLEGLSGELECGVEVGLALPFADGGFYLVWVWLGVSCYYAGFVSVFTWVCGVSSGGAVVDCFVCVGVED